MNFFKQKFYFFIFLICTHLSGCNQSSEENIKILGYTDSTLKRHDFSMTSSDNTVLMCTRFEYEKDGKNYTKGPILYYRMNDDGEWKLKQSIDFPYADQQITDFGKHMTLQDDYAFVATSLPWAQLYIYKRNASDQWDLHQKTKPAGMTFLKYWNSPTLKVSGNTLAIGDYEFDTTDVSGKSFYSIGKVYIYQKDGNGFWNQGQVINSPEPFNPSQFGWSISLNEKYMAVAGWEYAEGEFLSEAYMGAVFIYEKDNKGQWIFKQKILSSEKTQLQNFGTDVYLWNNQLIVGARGYNEKVKEENYTSHTDNAGCAYIFERDKNGTWVEKQKLMASDKVEDDYLGWQVAMNDQFAVVSTILKNYQNSTGQKFSDAGAVYVFEKSKNGSWKEKKKIISSNPVKFEYFGYEIFLKGKRLIVGTNEKSSSAYVFNLE